MPPGRRIILIFLLLGWMGLSPVLPVLAQGRLTQKPLRPGPEGLNPIA